jgi:hypothetical protein
MTSRRLPYILLAMGFLVRLAYIVFFHRMDQSIYSDMRNYIQVADQIMAGEWKATHFFQPIGFPYLIYLLKLITTNWMSWLEGIHLVTATASLYLIWKTAQQSFGEKVGLITLAITSLHFNWILFTSMALAENLFIFFLTFLAWLSLKLVKDFNTTNAAFWGLTFVAAFLIKGTHIFVVPIFLLGILAWKRLAGLKVVALISIVVWTGFISHGIISLKTIGKFQMSGSAGGLNFVEGKCPLKNNSDSAGYSWLSPLYYQLDLMEMKKWDKPFTDSGYFMGQGLECIKRNPMVLVQSLEGIPFLFIGNFMWPASHFKPAAWMRLYELFFSIFLITGLCIFITLVNRNTNRVEILLVWVTPMLGLFLCVYIFKSEVRFRVPFDVWLIPMAVKGWVDLIVLKRQQPLTIQAQHQ